MKTVKSFNEIIRENLIGVWCDGLALIEVDEEEIRISNIYNNNGKNLSIDGYPMPRVSKEFSKVIEVSYEEAIRKFKSNDISIISPKVNSEQIQTFEKIKWIEYGGNVYSHTKENEIIVNDKSRFNSMQEVESMGFISDKEKEGKWLVF